MKMNDNNGMEDKDITVSRRSIINAIANTCFWLSSDNWTELMKAIESVQPVKPQDQPWITVSNPLKELPKDKMLYVTYEDDSGGRYVEHLYYDMTEWSDMYIAKRVIAYKDYYEPEPYMG